MKRGLGRTLWTSRYREVSLGEASSRVLMSSLQGRILTLRSERLLQRLSESSFRAAARFNTSASLKPPTAAQQSKQLVYGSSSGSFCL